MKNRKVVIGLLLVAGWPVLSVRPQEMAKKEEAAKPMKGPSQLVLEQWNGIAGKLIAMAEDFPEDKYDFKATPAQRTFAENLLHAAGTTYYFTNLANGQKPPAEEDPKRANFKSKAEIVAFVKKCFGDG
ncbi:MAG TPA: DinB family protein, partial [Candidatus Acidoferrum sp.]|nr:DinB family protein [Candidatus Acidoferrum sp.]